MARKLLNAEKKSKMRSISLRDSDVTFIKDIGEGSLTAGIRRMQEMAKTVMTLDSDFKMAEKKLTVMIELSSNNR